MGGAACKLLLNSGGVIGTLTGISNVIISPQGSTISPELIKEGEGLICGFHEQLREYEEKLLKATGYTQKEQSTEVQSE